MTDRSPAFIIRGELCYVQPCFQAESSGSTSLHDYTMQHRDRVRILQLLVENEISRLSVWCNAANDFSRIQANAGNFEKAVSQVS